MAGISNKLVLMLGCALLFATSSHAEAPASQSDIMTVPLRREMVPVMRRGEIVSYKNSYSGVIFLGQPQQEFRVIFDTGSGHVIVPSSKCQSDTCLVHRRYDKSASSDAKYVYEEGGELQKGDLPDQATIHFGTGNLTGELVQDSICAGPMCLSMNMVSAVQMSSQPFKSFAFDGIVGLGLSSLSLSDSFSILQSLSNSGAQPRFSVYLTEGEAGEESEISFGGTKADRHAGQIYWAPLFEPEHGHWQVRIKAFKVGGVSIGKCEECNLRTGKNCCKGIVDTGTSHLGIPAMFNAQVNGMLTTPVMVGQDGGDPIDFDCREIEAPPIEIEFEGFSVTLEPENYMRRLPLQHGISVSSANGVSYQNIDNSTTVRVPDPEPEKPAAPAPPVESSKPTDVISLLQVSPPAAGKGTSSAAAGEAESAGHVRQGEMRECRPRLIAVNLPAPLGPNLFILGEPILHRYYTVYDWQEGQIGFGRAVNNRYKKLQAANLEPKEQDGDDIVLFQTGITVEKKPRRKRAPVAEACDSEPFIEADDDLRDSFGFGMALH